MFLSFSIYPSPAQTFLVFNSMKCDKSQLHHKNPVIYKLLVTKNTRRKVEILTERNKHILTDKILVIFDAGLT